jgi:UDP-3-O-[3-hydroxymyristoyl] N-acetylglucosamine deacetylase
VVLCPLLYTSPPKKTNVVGLFTKNTENWWWLPGFRDGEMAQQLLRTSRVLKGVGIHSGKMSALQLVPQSSTTNRIFFRQGAVEVQASSERVTGTGLLRTELGPFQTVEHLLGALWGMNVTSCMVDLTPESSTEIPIMDGSALPFVEAMEDILVPSIETRPFFMVKQPIRVESSDGKSFVDMIPQPSAKKVLSIQAEVDFDGHPEDFLFERNWDDIRPSIEVFKRDIAPARTFAFERDIAQLHAKGLGLGGNKDNCIIFSSTQESMNTKLRFINERARHKMLDILGDFSLLGPLRLVAQIRAVRPGHGINQQAVRALLRG